MTDMAFLHWLDFRPTNILEVGVGRPESSRTRYWWGHVPITMVEPNPITAGLVREAIEPYQAIDLHQVALCEQAGRVEIARFGHSTYVHGLPPRRKPRSEAEVNAHLTEVQAVTTDTIDQGNFDVALIDCESSEWYVLQHMVSRPKFLALELYKPNRPGYQHHQIEKIREWLDSNRYIEVSRFHCDGFFVRGQA